MLEPDRRSLLLDAIRPPDGYGLAQAVGTTYSLNLEALVLAPLSFALFDWGEDENPNIIALLEAVRRCADDVTIFCQGGQISIPHNYQQLLVHLEDRVFGVTPPNPDRIFHPKIWMLHFTADTDRAAEAPDLVRLLCLSRNLTFDRSWDTIVRLDGRLGTNLSERRRDEIRAQNAPLAEFLAALPAFASDGVPEREVERIEELADLIRETIWEVPQGFREVSFHPLGLGDEIQPIPPSDRMLVVSPFLTAGALGRLASSGEDHVLVSRGEALDAVGARHLERFAQTFVLTSAAWQELSGELPPADGDTADTASRPEVTDEAIAESAGSELTGLHAKMYLCERDGGVELYTGSANATDAAFNGNVEFLVRLKPAGDMSIDGLLQHHDNQTVFRDLLETYEPPNVEPPEPTDLEQISQDLDRLRRAIGACRFLAEVYDLEGDATEDETYGLRLRISGDDVARVVTSATSILCWPITLGAGHRRSPRRDEDGFVVDFGKVERRTLTSFFAIEIVLEAHGLREDERFVVNSQLVGAPADRRERIISDLLESRDDVLRYLLFLLSEGGIEARDILEEMMSNASREHTGDGEPRGFQAPLFESLVRALARDPARLDYVSRLVDDLRRTEATRELIPPALDAVWDPIWRARQELDQ